MQHKTVVRAENGTQEVFITRHFSLSVELVFRAHVEAELLGQWMGAEVVTLESRKYGCFRLETKKPDGELLLVRSGVIHDFIPNQKITRTFEMENTGFPVQLEFLEFEKLTDSTSQLNMQMVFKSVKDRDAIMKLPFVHGINRAHDKLERILKN